MIIYVLLVLAAGTISFAQGATAAQQAGVAAGVVGNSHVSGAARDNVVLIASGMDLLLNDRVRSEEASRMQILLLDETVLTIGPNSDLVIDKFIFDPETQTGEMAANLTKGALRYISGSIARSNPEKVVIRTAAATIGVRGTAFFITDDPESGHGAQFIGLLGPGANNDGGLKAGGITVSNTNGATEIFRAGYGTFVIPGKAPGPAVQTPPRLVLHVQRQLTAAPRPAERRADAGPGEGRAEGGGKPGSAPPGRGARADAPPPGPASVPPRPGSASGPRPANASAGLLPPNSAPIAPLNTASVTQRPGVDLINPTGISGEGAAGTRMEIRGVEELLGSLGVANIGRQTASQDMIAGTQDNVPLQPASTAEGAFNTATLSPATRTLNLSSTDALTGAVTSVMWTPTLVTTTTAAPQPSSGFIAPTAEPGR